MTSDLVSHAIILWAAIIPLAVLNGIARDAVLVRFLSPSFARTASGVTLSILVIGFACLTVGWLRATAPWTYGFAGALWLLLTVAFEFGFGRIIARKSWTELLRAYRFRGGDIWPIVLVVVATAPWIAARLRGLV